MAVPPLFANFGKNTNELLKKKFEFDPISFKAIRKAANGLTIESGGVSFGESDASKKSVSKVRGYTKFSVSRPAQFGSAEVELHTDAAQTSKASAKFTKLYPGVLVNIALSSKDKADFFKKSAYVASAEASYSKPNFAAQLAVKSDFSKSKADLSVSVGYEQWSAGGLVSVDTDHSLSDALQEVQAAAEYTQDDLSVSLFSSLDKSTRFINASFFQRVNRDLVAGGLFKFDPSTRAATVTVGSDYRVDADTLVRSKLEVPKGNLQLAVEHRLSSPQALVGLATEWDVSNPQQPRDRKSVV